MQVIEIFLPLRFPNGDDVPVGQFDLVQSELREEFGGVTAYTRSPAVGEWKRDDNVERDVVVIFEVVVDKIDDGWWSGFRARMEATFRQDEVMILI